MHYVPESSREFLPADSSAQTAKRRSVHYESAPLYLLTLAVGGLLLVDVFASVTGVFSATYFGYRWALLAAVLGGSRILYHTLDDLLSGRVGAGLALTIAFAAAVWLGEAMTAALVVFITLTGECVERYTIDRAHAAIRKVFDLYPPIARIQKDGREIECPLSQLAAGDAVIVRPGERLPADGRVLEGSSSIDQSALTGESGPVEKSAGDEVFAGTLNQFGAITFSVVRTGQETLLGQVTETVAEASRTKTPTERTADRLAKFFLPIVLAAALATFLSWWAITGDRNAGWQPTLGVLVVACPCALVLATPTAVMAALAWLARAGIVVKGSDALERLAKIDAFAFDKTGTLTRGEMELGTVRSVNNECPEEFLLFLMAAAEQQSEHPLARPFDRLRDERHWTLPAVHNFSATAGGGVSSMISTEALRQAWAESSSLLSEAKEIAVCVGNLRWLTEQGVSDADAGRQTLAEFDQAGETGLFLAVGGTLLGAVGVKDAVREEARDVLMHLKRLGVRETVLLTGDREPAALAVAQSLGWLDQTHAELLPADKARWVAEHQRGGTKLAMVGDGINDAPALAAADVGIAVSQRGGDLAAEAGDLVFLGGQLKPLPGLVRLSRAMVQNIRQSIFLFAFGLNGLGMLLCAVGVFSPVVGAVFHELGSLAVMLNALRLLWFEPTPASRTGRLANFMNASAEWLTAAFSPTRWVYRFVDHWNVLLRLAAAGVACWWLLSNLVFLTHDERAIVTRFGKSHAELAAGWHWRWPAPFERIYREKTDRLRTLTFGFRRNSLSEDQPRALVIDWTSPHEKTGEEPIPEEALVLTAEEVPVELTAEVHYRIADLHQFAFGNRSPEESLRAVTGQTLRTLAAKTSLDEMLTVGRAKIEEQSLARLRRRAETLRLGLEIVAVRLIEVHPPRGVVPAYRDVANALEEKEQQINEAQAAAASRLLGVAGPRALAELQKVLGMDFESAAENTPPLTDADWKRIAQSQPEKDGPRLVFLAGEAAGVLLQANANAAAKREAARGEAKRFQSLQPVFREQPELTATELYWRTIEDALSARKLTILDPKAVGRRHLLLANPEWAEFPPAQLTSPRPFKESRSIEESPKTQ